MDQLYLADAETGKMLYGFPSAHSQLCCTHWIVFVNLRDVAPAQEYFELRSDRDVVVYFLEQNLLVVAIYSLAFRPRDAQGFSFQESSFSYLSRLAAAAFVQYFFGANLYKSAFHRKAGTAKSYSKFTPVIFNGMQQRLLEGLQVRFLVYDGEQLRSSGNIYAFKQAYLDMFKLIFQGMTIKLRLGSRWISTVKIGDFVIFVDSWEVESDVDVRLLRNLVETWRIYAK